MFADSDSLLDEAVEILGEVGCQTFSLQDPQDLVAGDETDLGNTMGVTQDHTYRQII